MPIYKFRCSCKEIKERTRPLADRDLTEKCSVCNSYEVRVVPSPDCEPKRN